MISWWWWWWWWWRWWIVFVVWLTDEKLLALLPVGTIVRDPLHHESPTQHEQDLSLRITWVQPILFRSKAILWSLIISYALNPIKNILHEIDVRFQWNLNPFSTNTVLLNALETSENQRSSDVYREYRSGTLVENVLNANLNFVIINFWSPSKTWILRTEFLTVYLNIEDKDLFSSETTYFILYF